MDYEKILEIIKKLKDSAKRKLIKDIFHLIVVQAEDVLLVVDKTREQEIKHLINDIGKECKYNKYL